MNTLPRRLFRPPVPGAAALALLLLTFVAAGLAACGDDQAPTTAAGSGTTAAEPRAPGGGDAATSTDIEPGPGGGGTPDLPAATDDLSRVPCSAPPRRVLDATALVGEEVNAAAARARAAGCDLRVVIKDGEPLAVTQDFRPDRINVVVTDGEIENIDGLY